jgi:hypothetical protein
LLSAKVELTQSTLLSVSQLAYELLSQLLLQSPSPWQLA